MLRIICFVVLIAVCGNLSAQQCESTRSSSTPNENFFDNNDGTVTELETGLTWMRCVVGQHWNGSGCVGQAQQFTWDEALKVGTKDASTGWRVPMLAELATIVERQCQQPRINLSLFPGTPEAAFWTANKKKGHKAMAYALDFAVEGVQVVDRKQTLYLRLVSGRE